jgi:uncharacterized protein YifE (UPF0438 family)
MAVPQEHLTYLKQKGYALRCPAAFNDEEAAILARYGHWMEALTAGVIAPVTPEQIHFLQVARGQADPQTPFERVWHKLRTQGDGPAPALALLFPAPAAQAQEAPADHTEAQTKLEHLGDVRRYAEHIRAEMEAERQDVLRTVQAQLEAIEGRYAERLQEADQAIAELEAEVKDEVLKAGATVQAGDVRAIFYRGAVTWDSKGLARYAQANPEVEQFRKVGAPRVAIRYK